MTAQAPKSKAFRINLNPGRYSVVVSLCKSKQNGRTCYGDEPGFLDYQVQINTKPVALDLKHRILAKDAPPKIVGQFPDMILKKEFDEHKIRIDAIDPDADLLLLKAFTDSADTNVKLSLEGNILSILPNSPASNTTSRITIQAISKGKIVSRSFRILFSADSVAFGKEFNVGGKFRGQETRNRHKVILQGSCVIRGYNGYKNQAFFLNIKDSQGRELYENPRDVSLRDRFPRGVYYIESMLKFVKVTKTKSGTRTRTRTYDYIKGRGDTYNINFNCPDFDGSIALLEKDNRDVPPRIVTHLPDLILGTDFSSIHIPIKTMDVNGDPVSLNVQSNSNNVNAAIRDQGLSLISNRHQVNSEIKLTVFARANAHQTEKTFTIFLQKESIAFGKQFQVKGKIKNQGDKLSHPVILYGQCRITGDNGYQNQAFYTSVKYRDRSTFIAPSDKGITRFFTPAVYYLTASLSNEDGRYYSYRKGKGDSYKINVTCENMNATTEEIRRLLEI